MKIRILLICLLTLLCSCSREEINKTEYIDPVKDLFVFGELDDDLADRIRSACSGAEFRNYQFTMLEEKIYPETVYDIHNEAVDLKGYDKVCFDIVSVKCSHCKKMLHQLAEVSFDSDTLFVQYFNVGDAKAIEELYEAEGLTMRDDIITLSHSEELEDYIRYDLKIENYPTLITFRDGKVTFSVIGEFAKEKWTEIVDIGFEHPIQREELCDAQGNFLPDLIRTAEDVKESLSEENQTKLEELGEQSEDLTLKRMGKTVSFDVYRNTNSDIYYNEISDYSEYKNRDLILFYEDLNGRDVTESVSLINELIEADPETEHIVILNEGAASSSSVLKNSGLHYNCPVISMLASIPDDLIDYEISSYPTAVFIEKGTVTGVCAELDIERYQEAKQIFLGEGCIARIENNLR